MNSVFGASPTKGLNKKYVECATHSGFVEHLNGVLGRSLAAMLEQGELHTWERGLRDFLMGYRGLCHASTGKSPHQMLMFRPVRLPWKYHAMPRLAIPDNQPGEIVEQHMLKLGKSLKVLHESARVAMLKKQVRNLKEYNTQKAFHEHGHLMEFDVGDMNVNPRKNKLHQMFGGLYYIHKLLGNLLWRQLLVWLGRISLP